MSRFGSSSQRRAGYRTTMLGKLGFNFYDVFVYAFCILFAILCIYPMWYVLISSITPYEEYVKGGLMLLPLGGIDLQYYSAIFHTKAFTNSMWISVAKTVLATTLSMLITSTMAYACSKSHVKGMKLINALVVFVLFFTGGLIPQYMLYKGLGILRTFWVMVLPSGLNIVYFVIMRNYFSYSVPKELEEAALIDGCGRLKNFFSIVLPNLKPVMVTVLVLDVMWIWNDFLLPLLMVNGSPKTKTLVLAAYNFVGQLNTKWHYALAAMVLAILPSVLFFIFLQKYIVQGVVAGSIKG